MSGHLYVHFAEWLKQHRREAGISQDELAERMSCSASALRKIEAGERLPSRQMALLLAELFHLPPDEREAFVTFARTGAGGHPQPSLNIENTSQTQQEAQAPWRAAHLRQSNMPLALTSFIGREQDEEAVRDLLAQRAVRLLTLVGAPGIGKTRLSTEVAARPDIAEQFEDGVFMVELAPISDPRLAMPTIATALGLKETGGQPQSLDEVLLQYVQDKRMLLVLDNFEQVLDAASRVVGLLAKSPWLKVLTTSREALHVRGERRFHVPPLELPALDGTPNVQVLSVNPAVALFVARAQEVLPDFKLTHENAADVAAVCVGLDGLPLAIELAAARADVLSAKQMHEGLGSRLKLLTKGARDLPARQRTLRGAIEWSYTLLTQDEQKLFRRLGVFVGGFTRETAEAVYETGDGIAVDLVEGLASLVDKNLFVENRSGGAIRFDVLETIREYSLEQLEESGERYHMEREHALYFMRLAEEAEPHLWGKDRQNSLNRLEDEHNNIRAALRWAVDRVDREDNGTKNTAQAREALEVGLRLAGALRLFWGWKMYLSEGREHLSQLLEKSGDMTGDDLKAKEVRAKALHTAGGLADTQGDYVSARALNEESLAIRKELGDKEGIARSLNNLGIVVQAQGDYVSARALNEESLAILKELGDKEGVASSLLNLGLIAYSFGEYASALSLYEESLAIFRELGISPGIASALGNLGNVYYAQGDYASARSLYAESLAIFRERGNRQRIAAALAELGGATVGLAGSGGGVGGADTDSPERGYGDITRTEVKVAREEEGKRGARLLGAASALLEAAGAVLYPDDRFTYEQGIASARALLGEEEFDRARQEGRAMSMEQAIEYALADPSTC